MASNFERFETEIASLVRRGGAQESPHFENGLISALFGPHVERMGSPKAPHLSWRELSLDDCETRTRTSGLVIRDSPLVGWCRVILWRRSARLCAADRRPQKHSFPGRGTPEGE